jgi:primosomal protein N' (replication factor Y)
MSLPEQTLFGIEEIELAAPAGRVTGPVAAVALEDSLDKLLDYSIPSRWLTRIAVGQRVRVPLGKRNRPVCAYVVAVKDGSDYPRVKDLIDIEDERVLVTPGLLELSRWMSRYYCAPLGTVLDSVIPAAVKKRIGMGYVQMVRLNKTREELQELFEKNKAKKRRAIMARLLQVEPGEAIELVRLAREAGATPPTVRKMAALGVISIKAEADVNWAEEGSGVRVQGSVEESAPVIPDLNEDQQKVYDDLSPRVAGGGFSVNLLFGVTGSGKTEIYLRCIKDVVERGRQAIVLVPEIALTPQTVRRFTARFARVAVLHSGLTPSQRHRFWQQCASGRADVVVGARSAVFAPVPRLGIIVVDEEHEASYKQDQAPRYNARDVAIKRAQIERAPGILGSATPSLETYNRVSVVSGQSSVVKGKGAQLISDDTQLTTDNGQRTTDIYHMLSLPRRVRGLSMPHVELIDLKVEARLRPDRGHIHVISTRLEHLLRATVDKGQQAILLLNRRGYSNFVFCVSCQEPLKCKYCDTTMTYHRSAAAHAHSGTHAEAVHKGGLQCHYCLATSPLPNKCPTCSKKLSLFGLGTQRVEEELAKKFPDVTFARVDSDSMHSAKDYEALLARFAKNEIQVMLGTQMIAKGLDYPNVTLVGVISGDTSLSLPDFRAAERTFQLITQVAGRAGRGDNPGRVVLQTFMPDDPTIQAALRQDFAGFARSELQSRREVGLPPFARMVRIVMRDQEQEALHEKSEELGVKVMEAVAEVEAQTGETANFKPADLPLASSPILPRSPSLILVKGPMPCAINRIAGYYRNQIVLQSPRPDLLQKVLGLLREAGHLATSDRIAVDVDPVSLL